MAESAAGRGVCWLVRPFYVVVLLTALVGQATGVHDHFGWPLGFSVVAVAVVELGGVVLFAWADYRRRLGERAMAARMLSAAVAAGAVALTLATHRDAVKAAFFAGMSCLGYLVYVLIAAARRRDALRAAGQLPPTAPVYGLIRWVTHPVRTRQARSLALRHPELGLYGSVDALEQAKLTRRRHAAIRAALVDKFAVLDDPVTAAIAAHAFDLDAIAAQLAAGADNTGLAALIAADIHPGRLTPCVQPAPVAEIAATKPSSVDYPDVPQRKDAWVIAEFARQLELVPEVSQTDLPPSARASGADVTREIRASGAGGGAGSPRRLTREKARAWWLDKARSGAAPNGRQLAAYAGVAERTAQEWIVAYRKEGEK